ncbi:MAG: DoxX family protein [Candidatus Dormibacteraeota bacterium]|nr:DoxX family protein [Candidatus Dormibacteraeota bacterium]
MDASLLILRIVVGLYVLAHGTHKVFGWFGGAGPSDTEAYFREAGFRPARVWSGLLGIGEAVGGGLFAAGLLSPLGSIVIAGAMLISIFRIRLMKGLFESTGGIELPLTNLAVAVAVGIVGPGAYSIDRVLGITLRELPYAALAVIVAYLVVAIAWNSVDVRRRRRAPRDSDDSPPPRG